MGKRERKRRGIRPERRQDPRLTAVQIQAFGGEPVTQETWALVVSPVELDDGRVLSFHGPQVVAFNLIEAERHAGRGTKTRLNLLANLTPRDNGWWAMSDPRKALDAVRELTSAVLFAYTALEGLGNHTIDQLDAEATVQYERDGELVTVRRDDMVRRLSVAQKLDLVIPMFTGNPSIKGTALWSEFVALRRLRDGLVHPKHRGSNPLHDGPDPGPKPEDPGIYGMLMRGDADDCATNAARLVDAVRPDFLPGYVREALGL